MMKQAKMKQFQRLRAKTKGNSARLLYFPTFIFQYDVGHEVLILRENFL